jgi:hypothetical protein
MTYPMSALKPQTRSGLLEGAPVGRGAAAGRVRAGPEFVGKHAPDWTRIAAADLKIDGYGRKTLPHQQTVVLPGSAFAAYFNGEDCGATLFNEWGEFRDTAFAYKKGETWDRLVHQGSICSSDLFKTIVSKFPGHNKSFKSK